MPQPGKPTLWERARSIPVVCALTVALLCAPVLVDLTRSPARHAFGYVAADTFFYLTVARNIARHGIPSFDGVHPTNGFHPLWQGACSVVYFIAERLGLADYVVLFAVLLGLALVAAGVVFIALAFEKSGALSPTFLILPVGVYALLNVPVWSNRCLTDPNADSWNFIEGRLPLLGTLWSYANGMESGLVLFCFGLLAFLYTRDEGDFAVDSLRFAGAFALVAALMTLARLDHGLLVLPILLAFAARRRARARIAMVLAFALPLGAYLLMNRIFVGVAFPLSGAMKSMFPYFSSDNLRRLADLTSESNCDSLVVFYWREAQLCVPMLFAVLYLAVTFRIRAVPQGITVELRPSTTNIDRFLVPVALGVLALGAYDFLFVHLLAQGHWYFPVSTTFITLAVVALSQRRPRIPNWWIPVFLAVGVCVFVRYRRSAEFHARFARFYFDEAPKVRARYGAAGLNLLEFDDGIVSYSLDVPSMSGTLMLDRESAEAKGSRNLFRCASRRGFDRVASFQYGPLDLPQLLGQNDGAEETVRRNAAGDDISGFDFRFDYVSEDKEFTIVRMTPKK
jgi:hypothetical protein